MGKLDLTKLTAKVQALRLKIVGRVCLILLILGAIRAALTGLGLRVMTTSGKSVVEPDPTHPVKVTQDAAASLPASAVVSA